jgi:hypothetical protein
MALANELVRVGISSGTAGGIGGQGATIAATGSAITDAAALTASIVIVSGADGTKGVYLTGQVGDEVWVFNNAGSTLKVYGDSSSVAICVPGTGLGTAGTAFSHLTYKTAIYKKQSSTQWFVNVSA